MKTSLFDLYSNISNYFRCADFYHFYGKNNESVHVDRNTGPRPLVDVTFFDKRVFDSDVLFIFDGFNRIFC